MGTKKGRIYGKGASFKGAPQTFGGSVAPHCPPWIRHWHQMPFSKLIILENALVLLNSRCLSLLDLCSLCIKPRSKTQSAIIEHVHDSATIGLLTDNVVDSYIARTSELCNSLQSSMKFGWTECMTLVQVLQGKKIKSIAKTFANTLTKPCGSLRNHVFMLLNSHYQKFKTTLNFKTKLTKLNLKLHKS